VGALAVAGCAHLGPKTVAVDRYDYSVAIADSWKRQTLLNIVKWPSTAVPCCRSCEEPSRRQARERRPPAALVRAVRSGKVKVVFEEAK